MFRISKKELNSDHVGIIHRNSSTTRLRRRLRLRRNFMFFIWTVLFIFYHLNTENDGSGTVRQFCAEALSIENGNGEGAVAVGYFSSSTQIPQFVNLNISEIISEKPSSGKKLGRITKKYGEWEVPGVNCTPPGIDDFPTDLFSPAQREKGYVIVHFIVSMYIFYALALVCDDYFVPSMECICEELKMPSDVAGATFMAIATSAPELFTNIIGTFITHGDIGIGAIVGSAVFNILAVVAVCGLGAGMIVPLEWYSITRDCLFYSLSVILLIMVLGDEKIYWYEALILVAVYALYIVGMYNNSKFKRRAEKIMYRIQRSIKSEPVYSPTPGKPVEEDNLEIENLKQNQLNGEPKVIEEDEVEVDKEIDEAVETYNDEYEMKEQAVVAEALKHAQEYAEDEKDEFSLKKLPKSSSIRVWIEWFVCWPIRAVYTFTIPDCREPSWRRWFPFTFIMCIIWIGVLSYVVNWMMTIIGHTLKIPDSVMGLTFIAAGTSIPEVVSSLIVSRQGLGTMALSNSIGSNTFDILMCLGLPWLIQASLISQDPVEPYIQINSHGLEYSAIMLIASLAVLYIILASNKYVLDRKVGFISLILYGLFLIFASLFELNVFFPVNLPTCQYHED